MYELYERIRKLCFDYGTTTTKMCADTGISRSTISTLRQGRAVGMKPSTLKKIADYFDMTVDELLDGINAPTYTQTAKEVLLPEPMPDAEVTASDMIDILTSVKERPEMKALFKSAQNASPDQIKTIVQLLDSMVGKEGE